MGLRKTKTEQRATWWKLRKEACHAAIARRGETGPERSAGASTRLDHCSQVDPRDRQESIYNCLLVAKGRSKLGGGPRKCRKADKAKEKKWKNEARNSQC